MRVAFLTNSYPKVSHTFMRREILELERQGIEVTRISIRGWDNDLVDPQDMSERERTHYVLRGGLLPLLLAVTRQLLFNPVGLLKACALAWSVGRRADRSLAVHFIYLAEACLIARWMAEKELQHLHAHFGTNPATVAMLVGVITAVPWSFTVHGPEEFDKPEFISLSEKIRRCSFAVAISSFGRSQMYRLVDHALWGKIKVVHCGLDTALLQNSIVPIGSSPRLVCVGRLCEQKGQLLLIEAARRLVLDGINFELVLIGDGELRTEIETLIRLYGMQERVRITGWLSAREVAQQVEQARALILPSFAEGLPVVIMEAMALGRPVVSTYVAGIPELVRSGEQGWLIPPGDVEALSAAMERCIAERPEVLAQIGFSARERVSQRHSISREVTKLIEQFRTAPDALNRGNRTARATGDAIGLAACPNAASHTSRGG